MMGCNEKVDTQCDSFEANEKPYHEVYLDAYKIDKFEVTAGDYEQCVDDGFCTPAATGDAFTYGLPGKETHPISGVNWNQAKTYCEWRGKRLPTEAEWEKAARGTEGRKYPWGNEPGVSCEHAFMEDASGVDGCGTGDTAPVGSRPEGASPYGVQDMIGGVWEWAADWYDADYYASSPAKNPTGPDSGEYRVARGGSWTFGKLPYMRASVRFRFRPDYASNNLGFRCAMNAE
jgi:formylglycine-generating enzyme required for sulfatase activity